MHRRRRRQDRYNLPPQGGCHSSRKYGDDQHSPAIGIAAALEVKKSVAKKVQKRFSRAHVIAREFMRFAAEVVAITITNHGDHRLSTRRQVHTAKFRHNPSPNVTNMQRPPVLVGKCVQLQRIKLSRGPIGHRDFNAHLAPTKSSRLNESNRIDERLAQLERSAGGQSRQWNGRYALVCSNRGSLVGSVVSMCRSWILGGNLILGDGSKEIFSKFRLSLISKILF